MPDTSELPAVAADSAAPVTAAQSAKSAEAFPPVAAAPDYSVSDNDDFFGVLHRHSLDLLQRQEVALKYALGRAQACIDGAGTWAQMSAELSRETLDTSRTSALMTIEDWAKFTRLWTEIGFQAAAPFVGRTSALH